MTTLIDYLPTGVRRILENWKPAPEPQAPTVESQPWGMGYCWVCGLKSFTVYLVRVDTGPRIHGPSIRPMWLHGHDQCAHQLPAAYARQVAANHEADCYIYAP